MSKQELKEERETLSELQSKILSRHPKYGDRPEAIQALLEDVGERWNEVSDKIQNYQDYGQPEAPETTGSGMSRHDRIHTGSR